MSYEATVNKTACYQYTKEHNREPRNYSPYEHKRLSSFSLLYKSCKVLILIIYPLYCHVLATYNFYLVSFCIAISMYFLLLSVHLILYHSISSSFQRLYSFICNHFSLAIMLFTATNFSLKILQLHPFLVLKWHVFIIIYLKIFCKLYFNLFSGPGDLYNCATFGWRMWFVVEYQPTLCETLHWIISVASVHRTANKQIDG